MEWGGENAIAGKSLPLAAVPTLFLFLSFLPLFGRANCRLRLLSLFSPPSTPKGRLSRWPQKGGRALCCGRPPPPATRLLFFTPERGRRPTTTTEEGLKGGLHARGRLSPGACAVRQRTQVGRSPKWLLTYSSASGGPPLLRTEKEERGREITLMLV